MTYDTHYTLTLCPQQVMMFNEQMCKCLESQTLTCGLSQIKFPDDDLPENQVEAGAPSAVYQVILQQKTYIYSIWM